MVRKIKGSATFLLRDSHTLCMPSVCRFVTLVYSSIQHWVVL